MLDGRQTGEPETRRRANATPYFGSPANDDTMGLWPVRHAIPRRPLAADSAPAQGQQHQHLAPQPAPAPAPAPAPGGQQGGGPGGRYRSVSRVSDIDVWDNMQNHHLQGADSSSSDEDQVHPRRRSQSRSRHTRHASFPSLFSSKKKSKASLKAGADDSWSESGEEGPSVRKVKGKPTPTMRAHPNASSIGSSRDFMTGRCMTCGSLVRWPRELHLFRCTICMTINDLQPCLSPDVRRDEAQESVAVTLEEPPGAGDDKPLSLGYTNFLIEQCLRSFLTAALKRQNPAGSPSHHHFSLSPDNARSIPPSTATPMTLRPKGSLNFEPRLVPGPPRRPVQHRRAPSWAGTPSRSCSTSFPERPSPLRDPALPGSGSGQLRPPASPEDGARTIFGPLEDYITRSITSFHCLNSSFLVRRSHDRGLSRPADRPRPRRPSENVERRTTVNSTSNPVLELDPKVLLLGDVAENGTWWTGHDGVPPGRTLSGRSHTGPSIVSPRSPQIDWVEMEKWYRIAIEPARAWSDVYERLVAEDPALALPPDALRNIEAQILAGQEHSQRALLKANETILRRPGRPITEPQDLRFLLIITANPLLHASYKPYAGRLQQMNDVPVPNGASPRGSGPVSGRHSAIIKRIVGLMSNTPVKCHNHLVAWFARYSEASFMQTKDLVAGFLTYRLIRQNEKKYEARIDFTAGLVPNMGPSPSAASLHAVLGHERRWNKNKQPERKKVVYQEDWQVKAAAQVLGFLFAANNMGYVRRDPGSLSEGPGDGRRELVRAPGQILATSDFYVTLLDDSDLVADYEAWERKQDRFSFCDHPFLLSMGAKIRILEHDARRQMETKARDAFFDSLLSNRAVQQFLVLKIRRECLVDDSLKAVSEVIGAGGEEIKKGLRISFKGEEGVDAGGLRKEWFLLLVRELFNPDHGMFVYDEDSQYCYFNPNSLEPSEQYFLVGVVLGLAIYNSTILDVALPSFAFRKLLHAAPPAASLPGSTQPRREPMAYTLDDLAEYRPRLAHGLRQLLAFEGDVESTFCLDFTLDTSRYGAIEKVPLCPNGAHRPVTNANRREYVDAYIHHLLDASVSRQFEPFKRGFYTVCSPSYSSSSASSSAATATTTPCPPITTSSTTNQTPATATKNALSLFRPEEIELLIRGSSVTDQALDVPALKAVASYDGWDKPSPKSNPNPNQDTDNTDTDTYTDTDTDHQTRSPGRSIEEDELTVRWFWDAFERAAPRDQRRLLAFVTGSDRVPAVGAASLGIRVVCLGDECGRFPTARTCFNSVGLWRVRMRRGRGRGYGVGVGGGDGDGDGGGFEGEGDEERGREVEERERERFERVLWRAVWESEGFGLK
ncbi:HECT-domain-containing protein [Parathielavia hyrcaniae]|uniref:HECT-type E3 ubiquitin transferase n=1 Tax=Parathielavia hyrcaniae TaxID=113614 RepID=A0AAN6Q468_9PEZI|nr:HECT-domain-containing protein [Parathielavia hyrcaniae]